jgi:hypothetical protein
MDDGDPAEPGTVTGLSTKLTLNWTPDRRHQQSRQRIARTASHPEIGAGMPATIALCNSIGCGTVPTFFWGGQAARAQAPVGPKLDPNGCLARFVSVRRQQLKKRARFDLSLLTRATSKKAKKLAAGAAKKKHVRP